jgi:hypothetical protein
VHHSQSRAARRGGWLGRAARSLQGCIAIGDDAAHRDYRDRYRAMATSVGFEGHVAWAEAMK